jgi:predicted CXXCH cytochrome family protein
MDVRQRYGVRWLSGLAQPALLLVVLGAGMAVAEEGGSRFSHKTHAPLKQPCTQCHSVSGKGTAAGFPRLAQCKVCHPQFTEAETRFPTQRVYRLPDFVFFSHRTHLAAKAECTRCHGNVAATDIVTLAMPPTMKTCVDCHKETKAPVECFLCHEIGQ